MFYRNTKHFHLAGSHSPGGRQQRKETAAFAAVSFVPKNLFLKSHTVLLIAPVADTDPVILLLDQSAQSLGHLILAVCAVTPGADHRPALLTIQPDRRILRKGKAFFSHPLL